MNTKNPSSCQSFVRSGVTGVRKSLSLASALVLAGGLTGCYDADGSIVISPMEALPCSGLYFSQPALEVFGFTGFGDPRYILLHTRKLGSAPFQLVALRQTANCPPDEVNPLPAPLNPPPHPAPGPLALLGVAAAFCHSRKLRKRVRGYRSPR